MNQIWRLIKRAAIYYKREGFYSFAKAALAYLLKKYRMKIYQNYPLLKIKSDGQKKRIFYIDYFSPANSNFYWLRAFQRFGKVSTFDIVKENRTLLKERIMNFKPVHIHLGGSVKDNMVSPQFLSDVRKELSCSISVFYGDSPYSSYHYELAKVVDYIYISNKTHIKINSEKGLENFKYMPCPTNPDVFRQYKSLKVYDVLFIGNNNQVSRLPLLKELTELFDLKVFGSGWEKTGLNFSDAAYGKEFSKVCSKAKINIGILDAKWSNLEAYFSNRLVNTLATGSFYIQCYTPGLEKVFTNKKHLVWYTGENELFELIKYYLINEKEREEIAAEGQREVYRKYTYERSVKRILEESEQKGRLRLHLGCGSVYLNGYVNIDKYNPKADRIMDVCELDYPDNSVDQIFTSHMVEHIIYARFMNALKEWRRVLKAGGELIIRCPNFERHLRNWLNGNYRKRWGKRNEGVNIILGFQDRGPGYPNRNLITVRRLKDLVSQAEFEILECNTYPTRNGAIPDGDILLKARKRE